MPKRLIPPFLIPKPFRSGNLYRDSYEVAMGMLKKYGWIKSKREGKCVDREGNPIPWITYPAIDFLSQLDCSERSVFEYGSGFSTLFWASRAKNVVAVESDLKWYNKIKSEVPSNCEILFSSDDLAEYSNQISNYGKFDVITIDGLAITRPSCSIMALLHIKESGFIILDNSDTCLNSAYILRSAGLIQVDFTGFAPLDSHAHTTSIFLTRGYDFQPRNGQQPHKSVAQPNVPWGGA
ncbi:MAG TPA: hypothetical protein VNA26_01600 [Chitinophagaceae bacterium]|nr:hypothetical protein [Chitinophagaceae bacterium]